MTKLTRRHHITTTQEIGFNANTKLQTNQPAVSYIQGVFENNYQAFEEKSHRIFQKGIKFAKYCANNIKIEQVLVQYFKLISFTNCKYTRFKWLTDGKLSYILRSIFSICLTRQIDNQCVFICTILRNRNTESNNVKSDVRLISLSILFIKQK